MFMYLGTNSSVCSWQILYVNYVLQYVNGNADTLLIKSSADLSLKSALIRLIFYYKFVQ